MPNLSQAPTHIIRTSTTSGDASKGEPTLLVSNTSNYDFIYNDYGCGASMDIGVWRPRPADTSFFILGDYAQPNYSPATGDSIIVKAINDDPDNPLLKAPTDYLQVWNDSGTGGRYDGSFWFPVAPDGYHTIGYVCVNQYKKPAIANYMCVRRDLTEITPVGKLIWKDTGARTTMDISTFQVDYVPGVFVAQADYNPYAKDCYRLKGITDLR